MKKYNNKYMTDKEIIDLMKLEVEYYKKELEKLKQIKKDNKIEKIRRHEECGGKIDDNSRSREKI